jgi:hypothetical protein
MLRGGMEMLLDSVLGIVQRLFVGRKSLLIDLFATVMSVVVEPRSGFQMRVVQLFRTHSFKYISCQ